MVVQANEAEAVVPDIERVQDGQIGTWLHRRFLQAAFEKQPDRRSASRNTGQAAAGTVCTLTPRDKQAIQILNHAIEHLMSGMPADSPDTVFADLQHRDLQAAAILARVSREFFTPTAQPSSEQLLRVSLRVRMRAIAAHFGLTQAGRKGSVIPLR